jgi:threonine synthase
MHFISTRASNISQTLSQAICSGLSDDGGLFVPAFIPEVNYKKFNSDVPFPAFAAQVLKDYFATDALENKLPEICQQAFNFALPVKTVNSNTYLLELFHGPTSSFKDFGARFLAQCLANIPTSKNITIMVATSGDTGSAVAGAFHQQPNIKVLVLYPKGQISERQQHQITCWNENVLALAVTGTFDDCQRLVKSAFTDSWWRDHMHLSSANSINLGRLLPQITYYAYSSVQFYQKHGNAAGFIIPTGNLGNATAAYYAKLMGFPIREIVLATNANKTLSDYITTREFKPRPSIQTLANAMDVGNPSNFERLSHLFPTFDEFSRNVSVISVTDEEIENTIKHYFDKYHLIICPHTATACYARQQLSDQPWIIVATADPSKFDDIIVPIINDEIPIAPELQALLDKPTHFVTVPAELAAIKEAYVNYFVER